MKDKPIRILICDDHELFRAGIIEVLRRDKFVIVGEAPDGERMIEKYFSTKPDVVLADISMPILSGFEAAKEILKQDSEAKILLVSMNYEDFIRFAYVFGIKGVLSKDIAKDELKMALRIINDGGIYFGANYPEEVIKDFAEKYQFDKNAFDKSIEVITEREEQVIQYISEGLMSSEIAERLNISKKAVDAHRQKIMQKFNLKSLSALITFSIKYVSKKIILL